MTFSDFIEGINNGEISRETPYGYISRGVFLLLKITDLSSYDSCTIKSFHWGTASVPLITNNRLLHYSHPLTGEGVFSIPENLTGDREMCRFDYVSTSLQEYPTTLIDIFGLRSKLLNPFVIHSYHGDAMRTNVGNASMFLRLPSENRYAPYFTYLGLELEVCGERAQEKVTKIMADPANKDIFEHFDISEDGSIRGFGYEFVSLPLTRAYLEANRPMFKKLYQLLHKHELIKSGSSTHIHYDHSLLANLHDNALSELTRLLWGSANPTIQNKINIIYGREPTRFCGRTTRLVNPSRSRPRDHYNWVSYDAHSFEIRSYGANLDENDLINKIDFTLTAIKLITEMYNGKSQPTDANQEILSKRMPLLVEQFYLNKLKIQRDLLVATNSSIDFTGIYRWWSFDVDALNAMIKTQDALVTEKNIEIFKNMTILPTAPAATF